VETRKGFAWNITLDPSPLYKTHIRLSFKLNRHIKCGSGSWWFEIGPSGSSLRKTIEFTKQCTLESTSNDYAIRYISTFFPSYILCGFIPRRRHYLKLFSVGSKQVGINRRGFGQKRFWSLPNPSTFSGFASDIYVNHEKHAGIHDIPADIRTWHLPNTRLYRYSYTVLYKSFL